MASVAAILPFYAEHTRCSTPKILLLSFESLLFQSWGRTLRAAPTSDALLIVGRVIAGIGGHGNAIWG